MSELCIHTVPLRKKIALWSKCQSLSVCSLSLPTIMSNICFCFTVTSLNMVR